MTSDPLRNFGPHGQRELFERFSRESDGFSTEAAIGAASNIILNAIRQSHTTRLQAEVAFDSIFGQMKALLLHHYDSLGRKRGLFPYHQTIEVPHFDARKHRKG